jgi:hypothetical protein
MANPDDKTRFALYAKNSTLDMVTSMYKDDNCRSKSEYIEKAIIFYSGFLSSNKNSKYLPNVVTSTVKATVEESEDRLARILFKLAVELAVTMNVVAYTNDISQETLSRVRGECVDEVKRLNGTFSFDDAYHWQNG